MNKTKDISVSMEKTNMMASIDLSESYDNSEDKYKDIMD